MGHSGPRPIQLSLRQLRRELAGSQVRSGRLRAWRRGIAVPAILVSANTQRQWRSQDGDGCSVPPPVDEEQAYGGRRQVPAHSCRFGSTKWILQRKIAIGVTAILPLVTGTQAFASGLSIVVVELFTSQGCSSCPPANANLIRLSTSPDVLTLSYSVTYWDYLGWKDTFGNWAFTARQAAYEPKLGQSGPFTPQMVINGKANTVGYDLTEVSQLVAAADTISTPKIALDKAGATVSGRSCAHWRR